MSNVRMLVSYLFVLSYLTNVNLKNKVRNRHHFGAENILDIKKCLNTNASISAIVYYAVVT